MHTSRKPEPDQATLLVVDDDPSILSQLHLALGTEFHVQTADDPKQAWKVVQRDNPELITLDLALDGTNPETGFALLEECLRFDPFTKIVLITGNDNRPNALRAIDRGAADILGKPVDLDALRVLLRRLQAVGSLERQNATLQRQTGEAKRLGALLGASPEMEILFETIKRIATVDIAVLILGESGTGKELAAREIQRLSARADQAFVSINCGAIPENLIESELFGHEKGAFTGAHVARAGRLETANKGIILLDEVAELPMALQVKLLRFLQDHRIERIGGGTTTELDVRVLAATNKNLKEEVNRGRFREDLYYRLSVVNLRLPPLRKRREDILYLAHHFLERFCRQFDRGQLSFTAGARSALQQHSWPGNVRELENIIQKAVVISHGRSVDAVDLELGGPSQRKSQSLRAARLESDRRVVTNALRSTGGNVSKAAEILGVARPTLHELLLKLEIKAREYRASGSQRPDPRR